MMQKLQISLFGKFSVQYEDHILNALDGNKVQELFCYLLLYQKRPHSREILANLLWGDAPTNRSKGYLRKALWQLQSELNAQTKLAVNDILLIDSEWVQINTKANFWLDVTIFEKTFERVKDIPGWQLSRADIEQLKLAVDLYQGDLLECGYQDWCLFERTRFRHMFLIMLDKLMDYCETHGEFENGLVYGLRILRHDQARERTHRRLMRLHYLSGNRTDALRQYELCVSILKTELGVEPARKTIELYEQIQADKLTIIKPQTISNPIDADEAALSLEESLKHLQKLQKDLYFVQLEIQKSIKITESLLHKH